MMRIRTSLQSRLPERPTDEDRLQAMRRKAWREQSVAVLQVDEIEDDWLRQAVISEANRRYGRREGGR